MRADGPAARRWLFGAALLAASATSLVVAVEMVTRRLMRWRPMPWLPESPVALAALPLIALAALLVAHALSRTGTRGRARIVTASVFAALFASGVAVQWQLNARLQSDAFYYFAYLRSIAFDRDVDFTNDYPLLGLSDKAYLWQPPTVTGYAHSAWAIGPAILWAPFFGGAHLAALRQQGQGLQVATDGSSYPYRQAVCIAGLFYALLGTWFSIRAARQFFPASIAATGAALVVGGSFILWYALAEPSMAHAPTMAAVAAFVWYWTATMPRRSLVHWIGLGALAGFAGLVRWQSVLFALLPAIEALAALWRAGRARDAASLRSTLVGGVAFTVAAVVAFTPQMLAWKAIYGHYLAVSPIGPQIIWRHPHLVDVLFASQNGLFAMSPILYVAAIGLVIFARRRPAVGVPSLVVIAAMIYLNASIQDWWGSAGYGGRRFDGTLPLFVLGAAAAIEGLARCWPVVRGSRRAAVLGGLAVWNVTLPRRRARRRGHRRRADRRSAKPGRRRRASCTAGSGIRSRIPPTSGSRRATGVSPANYDLPTTSFMGEAIRPSGRIDIGGDDRAVPARRLVRARARRRPVFRWATQQARDLDSPGASRPTSTCSSGCGRSRCPATVRR